MNANSPTPDYRDLNASINFYTPDGRIPLDNDREAARQYFIQHVNQNTVFFHTLEEKLHYLVENNYYDETILNQYTPQTIKRLFQQAYAHKFRFPTFVGAYKYYTSYTLKTFDGKRYLERYEDRVVMTALTLAKGNTKHASKLIDSIIKGHFQPATPTFLNAGKKQRGEYTSCFLLTVTDNLESISRAITNSLQLSKRGGGVALNLTNIREAGAPIKKVENASSGIIPVMKLLEDSFSYANQLGARQGAGAVYLNAHHPDIMMFLDTRRENADEKIRIKTLSLGVVVPDITFELARNNEDMYLFSPYDVERIYGKPMADVNITEHYRDMVDNSDIRKTKIKARDFFLTISEVQIQSGYPYVMFEDNVNRANPNFGKISMSNLCSEILQVSTHSTFNEAGEYDEVGRDISCNLGSMNVAHVMRDGALADTVETAVRALTVVSEETNLKSVPPIDNGNRQTHAIGLGQMSLHSFFIENEMFYGNEESIDFTSVYFAAVNYYALKTSNKLAKEKKQTYVNFDKSTYASGEYFNKYISKDWLPTTSKVKKIFKDASIALPTREDWMELKKSIQKHGLYNQNLQAVPPTGSISYINNASASIHPITAVIEIRKEGKIGRMYYPAPGVTNENVKYAQDAYEIGWQKLIDVYAAATEHVDQGLSLTLFFKEGTTTREINKAQIYAWRKGIKTIYYIRMKQAALAGTDIEGCVSCAL